MKGEHGSKIKIEQLFFDNNKRLIDLKNNKKSQMKEAFVLLKNYAILHPSIKLSINCTNEQDQIVESFLKEAFESEKDNLRDILGPRIFSSLNFAERFDPEDNLR